jgi:hypothetical protein
LSNKIADAARSHHHRLADLSLERIVIFFLQSVKSPSPNLASREEAISQGGWERALDSDWEVRFWGQNFGKGIISQLFTEEAEFLFIWLLIITQSILNSLH